MISDIDILHIFVFGVLRPNIDAIWVAAIPKLCTQEESRNRYRILIMGVEVPKIRLPKP